MSGYFGMGYFGAPRATPAPLVTRYGWNNDLTELPELTFDGDLSSGITDEQLRAGLSVASGALVVELADMIAAGASVGAFGVAWLTERWRGPAQLYMDANNASSTFVTADNGMAGLALYYYADADAAVPSAPPGGSAALTSLEFGRQGSGSRGYNRQAFGSATPGPANVDYVGGTVDWLPHSNGRSGVVRQGTSYPPNTSTIAISATRAVTSAPMADGHQGRMALIVRLTGSGVLPAIGIRHVQLDYQPV